MLASVLIAMDRRSILDMQAAHMVMAPGHQQAQQPAYVALQYFLSILDGAFSAPSLRHRPRYYGASDGGERGYRDRCHS